MAIPSSGYASADWTNPASDLTDFVGVVDLSDLPADFWTAVNSSDGARGRVAKDDGTTELASEWVEFDDVAETGLVYFKWSGTLSSTGTSTVRIYPPQSGNSSYAVTNTFGRNAVWSDYHAVWHLNEDPSGTAPQFTDATGNGRDLESSGSMTSGDSIAGKLNNAVDLDGDNDLLRTTSFNLSGTGQITMQFWNNVATGDGGGSAFGNDDESNLERLHVHAPFSDDNLYWYYGTPSNTELPADYTSFYDKWTLIHLTADEGFQEIFFDGTSQNSASNGATRPQFSTFDVGEYVATWHDGAIDELRARLEILPDDHISLEYSNQNDLTTFWGTWTWNAASGDSIVIDNGSFTVSTYNLFTDLSIPINNSTFTETGYNLFTDLSVPLNNQSFTQTGYNLFTDLSVPLNNGSFSLVGYDVVFNRSLPLDNGSIALDGKNLALNLSVPLDQGAFTLNGYDLNFVTQNAIALATGSFTLDGKDLSFNLSLPLDQQSFTVDGKELNFTTIASLEKATFNLNGQTLSFNQVIALDQGAFDLQGYTLLFDAVENIILLSGPSLITDIEARSTIADIEALSTINDIEGDSEL